MERKIEVILVDIGNTQIKSAEVINGTIQATQTWQNLDELNASYPTDMDYMLSSTGAAPFDLPHAIHLTHKTPLPIQHQYATPTTLGTDRIAALVGAYELFPNANSLVIDLGTCITMDMVTQEGVFVGGIISPGLSMRMKAMAEFTSALPDISEEWKDVPQKTLGNSTKECLLSGSYRGIVNEIQGTVDQLSKDFTTINVILSGGDAQYFESSIKAHIFAGSKIVLTGLYRIWKDLKQTK